MNSAVRLFLGAIILSVLGGTTFTVGLGAAFGRASNWSNSLAGLGILLLIVAGILAIATLVFGVKDAIQTRKFSWWLPLAGLAAGLALWGGWVAINL